MRKKIIFSLTAIIILFAISISFIYLSQTKQEQKIAGIYIENPVSVSPEPIMIPSVPAIEKIFNNNHSWIATLSAQKLTTIIATGDVIPARSVNSQATRFADFRWPFKKTGDVLKNADLTIINLESPLIPNCPVTNSGMVFCGNEKNIEGLILAGVDVATLENNHVNNWGIAGIENTVKILNQSGISTATSANPAYKDIRGLKIAFLAYNDLVNPQIETISEVEEKIAGEINEAKKTADLLFVFFHWGVEYIEQPTDRQKMLAYLAIDNGADLILGNHPHWIQPVEIYKDKLIVYAHGNFVFDQMWSEKTKEGVVGRYTFYNDKLIDAEFLPVYIKDYGQPYFLDGAEKEKIISSLKDSSLKLSME